ncbi:hypothetical protein OE699_00655 [Sedimentimonas flavescens]|uniref:Membrane protein DUF2238 n=1 Tax=Sedimentimonas flavescens TaxID=2851012 RepID=A0ABT2ZUC0_9RHOB|nr:hypothetical protein [Sedimentimonas flavescens]MCV2877347.1 hypothetical protein [Sedimentimonas flavescens]
MTHRMASFLLFSVLVLVFAHWLIWGDVGTLASEDGPLEITAMLLLAIGSVLSLYLIPSALLLRYLFVPYVFFQLALREAPVEVWIFDERVLSADFYREAGVSPASVVGAAYAAVALWSVVAVLLWGSQAAWRGARARAPWFGYFVLGGILAVAGQLAEELMPLAGSEGSRFALQVLEESAELAFAFLLTLSMVSAWRDA